MKKSKHSLTKSVVKIEDRTGDGNLLPEARERVLESIKEYLQRTGRLNISEIASSLNLSRQTVKRLTDEILMEWQEEMENQVLAQAKWLESVVKDIDDNPETFNKEKVQIVRLKSMLLGKINVLQKLVTKDNLATINFYLINRGIKKKLPKAK